MVTFKNSSLPDVLRKLTPACILLETDSPYLAPVPYRGKRNESSYIPLVAEKVAEIFNRSLEEIAQITTENAMKLFDIDIPEQE